MNNKKTIWNELNELPRSEYHEKNSFQQIEKKMKKSNKQKSLVAVFTTVVALFILTVLIIGIGQNETLPLETAQENGSLQAIYLVRDTEFDETKVKPSSLYSNVLSIQDPYVLENFVKYMNLKVPTKFDESIHKIDDPIIIELLFKYDNGKMEHFKMLDEETFYDMETKQWYFIDTEIAMNEDIDRYVIYNSFVYSTSTWHSFLFLALVIIRAICDSIIKRIYGLKKIKYIENNVVAKYIYYGLLASMVIFIFLIARYQLVIHIFGILLIFIIIGLFCIFFEKKYGSSKASFYSMIVSIIFTIGILMNILIILK